MTDKKRVSGDSRSPYSGKKLVSLLIFAILNFIFVSISACGHEDIVADPGVQNIIPSVSSSCERENASDSLNMTYYKNPIIRRSLPDPTVIKVGNEYFLYATEDVKNVPIYKSKNLVDWEYVGTAFTNDTRPQMVAKGNIWAPDINYINSKYVLFYSKSVWGGEWSCGIGRAIADQPEGPFYDVGKFFLSNEIDVQNSIDPFYIEDEGKKYLFWGSFHGIYGIELTDDGLYVKDGAVKQKIAGTFMEGTYIHKRNGYYYLFGSNGSCCAKEQSTYRICVGRASSLFGPYYNKAGKPLLENNYDVVLKGNDFVAGPGHNAKIVSDDRGTDWIIYHGYLREDPSIGRVVFLDSVRWEDDWPAIGNGTPSETSARPSFYGQ